MQHNAAQCHTTQHRAMQCNAMQSNLQRRNMADLTRHPRKTNVPRVHLSKGKETSNRETKTSRNVWFAMPASFTGSLHPAMGKITESASHFSARGAIHRVTAFGRVASQESSLRDTILLLPDQSYRSTRNMNCIRP